MEEKINVTLNDLDYIIKSLKDYRLKLYHQDCTTLLKSIYTGIEDDKTLEYREIQKHGQDMRNIGAKIEKNCLEISKLIGELEVLFGKLTKSQLTDFGRLIQIISMFPKVNL